MKKFFILSICCILGLSSYSQEYSKSVGLRGGGWSGISYKKFLTPDEAVEGILSFNKGGIQFFGLREYHKPALLEFSENIYFYYGHGAHLGYTMSDDYEDSILSGVNFVLRSFSPLVGIDGILGFEYRSPKYPIILALDYKPFVEFSFARLFRLVTWDFAFSCKFTF